MSYSAQLRAAGSHPRLQVNITLPKINPLKSKCVLWIHGTFPPEIILDKFELSQLHNEGYLGWPRSAEHPTIIIDPWEIDLEAPVFRVPEEPSTLLLQVTTPRATNVKGEEINLDIPLHMRYLKPAESRTNSKGGALDRVEVSMTWPSVLYACPSSEESIEFPVECATWTHRKMRFPSAKKLYPIPPSHMPLSDLTCPPLLPRTSVVIPTGVISDLPLVSTVNTIVVWLGALWLVWKMARNYRRTRQVKIE